MLYETFKEWDTFVNITYAQIRYQFAINSEICSLRKILYTTYIVKALSKFMLYGKYSRVVSRQNIALSFFVLRYICLSPTLFVPYFQYSNYGNALTHTYAILLEENNTKCVSQIVLIQCDTLHSSCICTTSTCTHVCTIHKSHHVYQLL